MLYYNAQCRVCVQLVKTDGGTHIYNFFRLSTVPFPYHLLFPGYCPCAEVNNVKVKKRGIFSIKLY